jgi:hypothetical protein
MRLRLLLALLLLAATAGAQESLSTVMVPVVGTTIGPGVVWRTDVEIVNDTGSRVDVAMDLVTAPDDPVILFDLGPGQTTKFSDVISQAFGLPFALSPLRVTSGTRRALTVRATVYGVREGGITKPEPIAVYSGQSYYPLRALDGLSFTDEYRTNIGLVNFGETPAEFLLALQRIPGRNLAVSYLTVEPSKLAQTSIQSLFPMISKGDDFTVVIETMSRDTYVYASVIDNEHAGRFVVPRVATR